MRPSTEVNQFRNRSHPVYGTKDDAGMNGYFVVDRGGQWLASCIVSEGNGLIEWEHVSVHMVKRSNGQMRTPTWEEMCAIKGVFFMPEETVIQFHPPKSEYVNMHPHVLHLWRWTAGEYPVPPKIAV